MCHNPSTSAGKFSLARHHPCRICSQQVKFTHALCSEDILPPWGFLKQCISKPMPLIARCSKTDVFLVFFPRQTKSMFTRTNIVLPKKTPKNKSTDIFSRTGQGRERRKQTASILIDHIIPSDSRKYVGRNPINTFNT